MSKQKPQTSTNGSAPALAIIAMLALVFIIAHQIVHAQEVKAQQAAAARIHLASTQVAFEIRDVQLSMSQISDQGLALNQQMRDLQQQYSAKAKALADLEGKAFEAQGLARDKYNFDANTLDFTPKPTPPPAATKPADPPKK